MCSIPNHEMAQSMFGTQMELPVGNLFMGACLSGNLNEVIELLNTGADINAANVDGLTALHQACISNNLEMVAFLVERGADVNRQDNAGWTPLHATASCGFVRIARYLVDHGAHPAAVNGDGDLAMDLAIYVQKSPMIDFMQTVIKKYNKKCEKTRKAEEQVMLTNLKKWSVSNPSMLTRPHPKTGATPLHVAAARGYTQVITLLLDGEGNVNKQDNDGWTPMHAAAYWGQKEAAQILISAMADTNIRDYEGQTCMQVADRKMAKFLEDFRANMKMKRTKLKPDEAKASANLDTIKEEA